MPQLVVELQPADLREVVALGIEEEVVEERRRGLERRRIAGAQAPVDLEDRLLGRVDLVLQQRVAQRRPDVQVVDEQHLDLVDAALAQQLRASPSVISSLHSTRTSPVFGSTTSCADDAADDLLERDRNLLDARRLHLPDRRLGELAAFLDDQLVGRRDGGCRARLDADQLIGLEQLRRLAAVEDDRVLACRSS